MLDIVPNSSSRTRNMPVNLAPYLLSASPPSAGFSFQSLSLTSSYTPYSTPYSFFSNTSNHRESPVRDTVYGTAFTSSSPRKSIMSVKPNKDSESHTENTHKADAPAEEQSTSLANNTAKKMKRVSFADHVGMPLAEVRFMLDSSADPPKFTQKKLNEITGGHAGMMLKTSMDPPNPPLIVPFPQPLTRENFNEELKRKMVAVENVIVEGYTVTCTIFVNKHATVKRVFGRYTLDSWQSHQDITAFYSSSLRVNHDTYQFKIQVPLSADRSKSIEFAVCYEADGVQHWDNNEGDNYTIEWGQEIDLEPKDSSHNDDSNGNPIAFGGMAWWCDDSDLTRPYY